MDEHYVQCKVFREVLVKIVDFCLSIRAYFYTPRCLSKRMYCINKHHYLKYLILFHKHLALYMVEGAHPEKGDCIILFILYYDCMSILWYIFRLQSNKHTCNKGPEKSTTIAASLWLRR